MKHDTSLLKNMTHKVLYVDKVITGAPGNTKLGVPHFSIRGGEGVAREFQTEKFLQNIVLAPWQVGAQQYVWGAFLKAKNIQQNTK